MLRNEPPNEYYGYNKFKLITLCTINHLPELLINYSMGELIYSCEKTTNFVLLCMCASGNSLCLGNTGIICRSHTSGVHGCAHETEIVFVHFRTN